MDLIPLMFSGLESFENKLKPMDIWEIRLFLLIYSIF